MKAPAATIETIAEAISGIFNLDYSKNSRVIGVRHGEKKHESLMTAEELQTALDEESFFRIPLDSRGMRYEPFFVEGSTIEVPNSGYSSLNAQRLDVKQVTDLLLSNREFQEILEH
jgi:UDP-glucose 4-epimerase